MPDKTYKAEIEFTDRKIRVEGPKEFVEEIITRYSETSKGQAKPGIETPHDEKQIPNILGNERDLIAGKRPHGHHEIVAVLAFALAEAGTGTFTEDDVRRAYIRAGVRPPKVMAQALRDAKNKFEYLELAGERGRYRLTAHGDRVVRFDLPRKTSG